MILSGLIIATLAAAQPVGRDQSPRILRTHFFVRDGSHGQQGFVETNRVPHRPGSSCYQWVIEVAPENRTIPIREVFELPSSAGQWNSNPEETTAVRRDRSAAVTEIQESLADGIVSHGWCVASGDPLGAHRIRVFAGDQLLHDFRFEVVADTY